MLCVMESLVHRLSMSLKIREKNILINKILSQELRLLAVVGGGRFFLFFFKNMAIFCLKFKKKMGNVNKSLILSFLFTCRLILENGDKLAGKKCLASLVLLYIQH